jgi:hypothetical protein
MKVFPLAAAFITIATVSAVEEPAPVKEEVSYIMVGSGPLSLQVALFVASHALLKCTIEMSSTHTCFVSLLRSVGMVRISRRMGQQRKEWQIRLIWLRIWCLV